MSRLGWGFASNTGAIMFKASSVALAIVAVFASSADASSLACKSIDDPMQRLACYDKAAGATTAMRKPAAANVATGAAFTPAPAQIPVKALVPIVSGPRYWAEVEGGIYGFSRNQPIIASTAPSASTGPTRIPTSPGFIGLVTTSTVTDGLATGSSTDVGGGGSFRMGYWLDPERTRAIEGSAFFVQGNSKFDLTGSPTTVRTTTFVNTTQDTFVGLFDDRTTTRSSGSITNQLYGADINYRVRAPYFGMLPNFDVMAGMRYVGFDEKLNASMYSVFSRTYQPALGLPGPTDFANEYEGTGTFRIRNNFIGPQIGFSAEQHWGRYWLSNETKLAVGATIEQLSVSGFTNTNLTPTASRAIAGIPIEIAGGAPVAGRTATPIPFGLFAQGGRDKTVLAVVPSGTIKAGYDVNEMLSLTLAYNYVYMSSVGRVGDQIASPTDIKQTGLFMQGITLGAKAKF